MKLSIGIGIIALGLGLAACKPTLKESEVESPVVVDGVVVASGDFEGRSDHEVSGGVEILKVEGGYLVSLGADFSLDGAPDPKVGLGKDGYQSETDSGALIAKGGASQYRLPDGVDPAKFNEVYIWCEKFDVPLGVAKLNPSPKNP